MRNTTLIIKNSARRNFTMVIAAIAIGILMGIIFNLVSSGSTMIGLSKIEIGYLDEDKSPLSDGLRGYLSDRLDMVIVERTDKEELNDLLLNMSISAIIKIPEGTFDKLLNGENAALNITMLDAYENAALIKAYSEAYMKSALVLSAAAEKDRDAFSRLLTDNENKTEITPNAKFSSTNAEQKSQSGYRFAVGFMLLASAGITFYIGYTILSDRRLGTYNRMRISSVRPAGYIVGNAIFGFFSATLMNVVFLAFPLIGGKAIGVPYALAFLLQELFVLAAIGAAIVLALLVKSQQQLVISLAVGFTVLGCMIGGAWFEIDESLGFISGIAKLFPQYWLMKAVRGFGESPVYNCLYELAALLLFAVLFYLIAAVIFAKKRGKNI